MCPLESLVIGRRVSGELFYPMLSQRSISRSYEIKLERLKQIAMKLFGAKLLSGNSKLTMRSS